MFRLCGGSIKSTKPKCNLHCILVRSYCTDKKNNNPNTNDDALQQRSNNSNTNKDDAPQQRPNNNKNEPPPNNNSYTSRRYEEDEWARRRTQYEQYRMQREYKIIAAHAHDFRYKPNEPIFKPWSKAKKITVWGSVFMALFGSFCAYRLSTPHPLKHWSDNIRGKTTSVELKYPGDHSMEEKIAESRTIPGYIALDGLSEDLEYNWLKRSWNPFGGFDMVQRTYYNEDIGVHITLIPMIHVGPGHFYYDIQKQFCKDYETVIVMEGMDFRLDASDYVWDCFKKDSVKYIDVPETNMLGEDGEPLILIRTAKGEQYAEQAARYGISQQHAYVIGTKKTMVGGEFRIVQDIIEARGEWAESEMKKLQAAQAEQIAILRSYVYEGIVLDFMLPFVMLGNYLQSFRSEYKAAMHELEKIKEHADALQKFSHPEKLSRARESGVIHTTLDLVQKGHKKFAIPWGLAHLPRLAWALEKMDFKLVDERKTNYMTFKEARNAYSKNKTYWQKQ